MSLTKNKITSFIVAIMFALFTFLIIYTNSQNQQQDIQIRSITNSEVTLSDYQEMLDENFDNSNIEISETNVKIQAKKQLTADMFSELENLSLDETEDSSLLDIQYDIDYNTESNLIYLTCTYSTPENETINEEYDGSAFYDENGNIDAVFNIDGTAMYLSEMTDINSINSCGLFSWLCKAIKKVAKVVVIAAAVVAVAAVCVATAGTTIAVAAGVGLTVSMTATATAAAGVAGAALAVGLGAGYVWLGTELIEDLYNTSAHQYSSTYSPTISQSIPSNAQAMTETLIATLTTMIASSATRIYFPAYRYDGKLFVVPVPVTLEVATSAIRIGADYWSSQSNALYLAQTASSGTVIGPEKDKNDKGYYYHYHLSADGGLTRYGGHSFFGEPFLGQY
jgi:hypothetical protein